MFIVHKLSSFLSNMSLSNFLVFFSWFHLRLSWKSAEMLKKYSNKKSWKTLEHCFNCERTLLPWFWLSDFVVCLLLPLHAVITFMTSDCFLSSFVLGFESCTMLKVRKFQKKISESAIFQKANEKKSLISALVSKSKA